MGNIDHQLVAARDALRLAKLTLQDLEDRIGGRPAEKRTICENVRIGDLLVTLKACVRRGEFLPYIKWIGLSQSHAANLMRLARRFARSTEARTVFERAGTLSNALELMVLDDEEMGDLGRDGRTICLYLYELHSMSAPRLREKVRQQKQMSAFLRREVAKEVERRRQGMAKRYLLPAIEEAVQRAEKRPAAEAAGH